MTDNPLWDPDLDVEKKLDYLLNELTLDEKLHLMAAGSGGVERLGIPECRLGGEAAHGVEARNDQFRIAEPDHTTSFPEPVGMSSSWDTEAICDAGRVVGREARIVFEKRKWGGISRWAPTVDLLRDPRWGRNEEAYGEDPMQTGAMASAYIRGMQGDDRDHIVTAATLKHFYANNTEIGRGWKNSSISPRNRYELYLEPFRRCIEDGGAEGVMTAYNRINGVQGLLNDEVRTILKDEFGLVHAVSDGGALELAASYSHVTAMDAETAAGSIKAGVDALSGRPDNVFKGVSEAYELGLLTEEDLDTAIRNVYRTKIRLGLFDRRTNVASYGELCSSEAAEICRRLTDSSIVLLKNDGILPAENMRPDSFVLIGPVGDKWYQDWYGGASPEMISLLDGLRSNMAKAGSNDETRYIDGCDRICLKCGGQYLTAGADGRIGLSDKADIFVLEDWGEGSYTFRNERTGKYMITHLEGDAIEGIAAAEEAESVSRLITGRVYADTERIFSWFDLEVFRMDGDRDGEIIMCDRFGNRLCYDKNGYIVSAKDISEGLTPLSVTLETIRTGIDEAVSAAAGAETVILALGNHPMVNAKEEIDRSTIGFIPYQQKLFDEIYRVNRNIIVVLMSDYPYAINEINEKARAVVWSATGSRCMGQSLADALTGAVHPAGRLTQTWYRSDDDLPDIDDYDIIGGGRTYRYFEKEVLYPFGFGLTYTEFKYDGLSVTVDHGGIPLNTGERKKSSGRPCRVYDQIKKDDRILNIEVTVTNKGDMTSDEVVQIYAKAPAGRVKKPLKQLTGFRRIRDIAPGEARIVRLKIPVRELAFYDVIRESLVIEDGEYVIMAGASSAGPFVSAKIHIDGATPVPRDLSKRIKADHYDEEKGTMIVEGLYGFSALMAAGSNVYDPRPDGHISATYADCIIPGDTGFFRIHGCAPESAAVSVYVDDIRVGGLTLNTRDYEKNPSEARNHMPRAAAAEAQRRTSWPLLWADIHIPVDMSVIPDASPDHGHTVRIEADGPFMYDWFCVI